jgi:hypothetical protein
MFGPWRQRLPTRHYAISNPLPPRALPLSFADLSGTDLSDANLSYAYLGAARGISAQRLHEQCKILIVATVLNGQIYEE